MQKIFAAILLASLSTGALGHDPGISEVHVCMQKSSVVLTWEFADADAWKKTDIAVQWPGNVVPANRTGLSANSGHNMHRWWSFDVTALPTKIELMGLDQLPFGHRVVATICRAQTETVLSAHSPVWVISIDGDGAEGQRTAEMASP